MKATTKKTATAFEAHGTEPVADTTPRQQVVAYVPEAMIVRLGQYMLDKYPGKLNVRNRIILAAIDRMLIEEGY